MSPFPPDNPAGPAQSRPWVLRLFVAPDSAASAVAIVQLKRLKAEYLPPKSVIEIINVLEQPDLAEEEQILAIPTLVRKQPRPIRRIIGDLSDIQMLLTSIGYAFPEEKVPLE